MLLGIFVVNIAHGQEKQKIAIIVNGNTDLGTRRILGDDLGKFINRSLDYSAENETIKMFTKVNKKNGFDTADISTLKEILSLIKEADYKFACIVTVKNYTEDRLLSADLYELQTDRLVGTAKGGSVVNFNRITATLEKTSKEILSLASGKNINDLEISSDVVTSSTQLAQGSQGGQGSNSKAKISSFTGCGCTIAAEDFQTKIAFDDIEPPAGWRLPTREELKCMCKYQEEIGNFQSGFYWSSERKNSKTIYGMTFNDCDIETEDSDSDEYARFVKD